MTLRDLFAKWRAEGFTRPRRVALSREFFRMERSRALAVQVEDQQAGDATIAPNGTIGSDEVMVVMATCAACPSLISRGCCESCGIVWTCDDIPEAAFNVVGDLADVKEKAATSPRPLRNETLRMVENV